MSSIKINIKFWFAGLIAGVILMERWRRYGARSIPQEGVETPSKAAPADKPKASKLIVTGAKADAKRVISYLGTSTSSPAETDGPPPSGSTSA